MRNFKRVLSALLASALCMGFVGCAGGSANSVSEPDFSAKEMDSKTREEVASLAAADERLTGDLGDNKTIKWLSDWDINPDGTGKSTPTELAIFQERYGGEVKWYNCIYDERYDQLANYINSDEGIDFFYAGNFDAFPKGAIRGMFVPYDEYIDLDSDLWKDIKDVNDSIAWGNDHYMAVTQLTGDNCAVVYNRKTVEELGFDDPKEMFEDGEWTWDVFEEMLEKFVDPENQKYGLDGWWFESGLSGTVGVPYVGLEDGKLVSNLADSNIERVQNYLYDLYNKNCIAIGNGDFGWSEHREYMGEGKELFYLIGLWGLYGVANETNLKGVQTGWQVTYGEDCMFVPLPKDPEADEYYIPANMESYCFVKGGGNPVGVAKFLDCKRLTMLNDDIKAIADQQFVDDYSWTEEMIEMKNTMDEMALEHGVIDFKAGVSTDLADMLDSSEYGVRAAGKGTPWNESLAQIKEPVQTMIDDANNS